MVCTEATAPWCPIHGDCTCSTQGDTCPLHDPDGSHVGPPRWLDEPCAEGYYHATEATVCMRCGAIRRPVAQS